MSVIKGTRWFYTDTSSLPPYFTRESGSERAEAFFTNLPKNGKLALSHWTLTEFHSAIAQKVRNGYLPAEQQAAVLARFNAVVDAEFECWGVQAADYAEAAILTNQFKLRLCASDALHLAIAKRQHATLVTLDDAQLEAAAHYRIPVVSF